MGWPRRSLTCSTLAAPLTASQHSRQCFQKPNDRTCLFSWLTLTCGQDPSISGGYIPCLPRGNIQAAHALKCCQLVTHSIPSVWCMSRADVLLTSLLPPLQKRDVDQKGCLTTFFVAVSLWVTPDPCSATGNLNTVFTRPARLCRQRSARVQAFADG